MSNSDIDRWYQAGIDNGAVGGKLVGRGAGGFLLFYAKDAGRLREAMDAEGLTEVRFFFDHDGSTVMTRTSHPVQVVVLAGGLGTRMRPRTDTVPKALLPVAGRPFAERQVELLAAHGVEDVVFSIAYLGHMIRDTLGDGSHLGVRIRYVDEGEARQDRRRRAPSSTRWPTTTSRCCTATPTCPSTTPRCGTPTPPAGSRP